MSTSTGHLLTTSLPTSSSPNFLAPPHPPPCPSPLPPFPLFLLLLPPLYPPPCPPHCTTPLPTSLPTSVPTSTTHLFGYHPPPCPFSLHPLPGTSSPTSLTSSSTNLLCLLGHLFCYLCHPFCHLLATSSVTSLASCPLLYFLQSPPWLPPMPTSWAISSPASSAHQVGHLLTHFLPPYQPNLPTSSVNLLRIVNMC